MFTVHAQTTGTPSFDQPHNSLLPVKAITSGQSYPLSAPPTAKYDEQLGVTFTQDLLNITYNVTAVLQTDSNGYGPAYLVNGLSNDNYWYQVGLSYHWPYSGGGYVQGFSLNYEVFNSAGSSIFPTGGGGGLQSFSGAVNSGDLVLLNLYVNNGIVYMYAKDWNTSAIAQQTYPDSHTTEFISLTSGNANGNGFFSGLMTEWWHVNPYSGDESMVNYTDNGVALSSACMWIDEWEPGSSWSGAWGEAQAVTFSSNPSQLQSFSDNGASEYCSAYQFITGSLQQSTSVTLLPAGASNPLSATDFFEVSYTINGQPAITQLQGGTVLFSADGGSNVSILGVSADSDSTEGWVLNSEEASVTIPAGSTITLYYYDLLSQQAAYTVLGSGNINPTLTYYTAPLISSSQSNPTATETTLSNSSQQEIWILRGTTANVTKNILGTAGDQWATPNSSWNISQANQIYNDIPYYHQYQVTIGYSTSDGSVIPFAPLLSGTEFGGNYQTSLLGPPSDTITWLDENTPWSISSTVTAPSETEEWICVTGASGNIVQAVNVNLVYIHQYYLTVTSAYGSPSGEGWYNASSTAYFATTSPVAVATGTQYVFSSWDGSGSGSYCGSAISSSCTMNAPITETVSWTTQYYLTVSSSYSTTLGAGWYNSGTTSYAGISSGTISGGTGTQYVFSSWSIGGTSYSQSNEIIMNSAITATALWTTQYQLTISTNFGTISPVSSTWYNAGSLVTIYAVSPSVLSGEQYAWNGWTGSGLGSYSGTGNNSALITMNAQIAESASWSNQYLATFTTSGLNFSAQATAPILNSNGVDYGSLPCLIWVTSGTPLSFSYSSTIACSDTGEQFAFSNVNASSPLTISAPVTITATYGVQYYLTVSSPYGSPTGQGWYNIGASASFGATSPTSGGAGVQYLLSSWTGSNSGAYNGSASSYSVTMNDAITETASWTTQYYLTVDNGGTGIASGSGWYDSGSIAQVVISSDIISEGVGAQCVFAGWTGDASGSGLTSDGITMNSAETATASWTTQYQLTFAVTPSGCGSTVPTGEDLWVNLGPLSISVSPNSGCTFYQWIANGGPITFSNSNALSTTANVYGPGTIIASLETNPIPTPNQTAVSTSPTLPAQTPILTPTPTPAASTPPPSPSPNSSTIQVQTDNGSSVELAINGNVTSLQITNALITTNQSEMTTIISFTLTGQNGTTCFSNMTIPKNAIPYGTTPTVYIDSQEASNQGYTQNSKNFYMWYTTNFGTHEVSVVFDPSVSPSTSPPTSPTSSPSIPEFPVWIFLPLYLTAIVTSLLAVFVYKTKKRALQPKRLSQKFSGQE